MGYEQDGIIPINLSAFALLLIELIRRYGVVAQSRAILFAVCDTPPLSAFLSLSGFASSAGRRKAGEDPHPEEAACSGGTGWKGCNTRGGACCSRAWPADRSTQKANQTEAEAERTAGC